MNLPATATDIHSPIETRAMTFAHGAAPLAVGAEAREGSRIDDSDDEQEHLDEEGGVAEILDRLDAEQRDVDH